MNQAVLETQFTEFPLRRGKVRDIYDLGDQLLLVASDRISAFDVVMPSAIPDKGRILTRLSAFWFDRLNESIPHHLIRVIENDPPAGLQSYGDQLRGRAMLCKKTKVAPIECVVRGYLAGSGWKEYLANGTVCSIPLPKGLKQCERLAKPIFTPSTKADVGHDENISFQQASLLVGESVMRQLRDKSIEIYTQAAEYAIQRGLIIADTKFEWGFRDGQYLLIDEVLTPDSSRFWPADQYQVGRDQDSFDKQYLRNYLQNLCDRKLWNKTAPGPTLPEDVIMNTRLKYIEAYERLIGKKFQA